MTSKEVLKQINDITSLLIGSSLIEKQNFPNIIERRIYISGDFNHAISLKTNICYEDIYNTLLEERNYNLLFIDGAILQFMYEFNADDTLLKARLCYFPSPNLLNFDEGEEVYNNDDIYADIISRNLLPTAIRFDYDPSNHEDTHHACSHVSFGQYKNCRIPVSSALTPHRFIDFIIRNFYHNGYRGIEVELEKFKSADFSNSITENETEILHFNFVQNQDL